MGARSEHARMKSAMIEVRCCSCSSRFMKLASNVRRSPRHFCSMSCFHASIDWTAFARSGGRASASRPTAHAMRVERSRKGGLQRSKTITKDELRRISMLGVAARMALPSERRSAIARRAAVTGWLTRKGQLPRSSKWHQLSPAFTKR